MKYDRNMHRSHHRPLPPLGTIQRHGPADSRPLPPRTMVLGWVLAGVVPWTVLLAILYW